MSTIDPAAAQAEIRAGTAANLPIAMAPGAGAETCVPRGPIRRVAALGIGLGFLGAVLSAGIPLLTDAIAQAFFNLDRTPLLSSLIVALPTVTLGLYMLLLFYGIRLALTDRRPAVEASQYVGELCKFRGVCAPLLVGQLLVVTLDAHREPR